MSTTPPLPATDSQNRSLTPWLDWTAPPPRIRGHRQARHARTGLRFAFYGRTSTGRFQNPASSREWQHEDATAVITGHGHIVIEFFDIGYSRSLPWHHRPQAAALLQAAADPHRGFDAVIIGEFERAFTVGQARSIIAQLHAYGLSVWMAEFDGPVDLTDPTHQAMLMLLGHQAAREVLRARHRTTAAMCAQARTQGRHLGGSSVAGIARTLNSHGVPPPSAYDPARNPHRTGVAWTLRTIATILANPRYTGRQVWNRQRTDHHESRPGDKTSRAPGSTPTRVWNPRDKWEISAPGAHPALISDADFVLAQQITAVRAPEDGTIDRYQMTGLVICGLCGRRAEGHWAHGLARYRCRHGHTTASGPRRGRLKTLYVRQDHLIEQARTQLAAHIGADPRDISIPKLAAQLGTLGFTMVCTPTSIILDTGLHVLQFKPGKAQK